jgi:hypothetical protein
MLKGLLPLRRLITKPEWPNDAENRIAEERDKAIVNEKLSDLIELENTIEEKLDNRFDELMSKVDEQTTILTRIYTDVGSVMSAV